ncbi:MAG: MFS transporter [Alloprevotella sp.]|nr:MFS transporter [Alloprevotella sp.]
MKRYEHPSNESTTVRSSRNAWSWVPTLYFAEGIPYVVVMTIAVVMYKRLGLSNEQIALYTSWLYLPWVIKPFWSPIVELLGSKRRWILITQLLSGVAMGGVALTIEAPYYLQLTLAFFWLMAFSSATHDIAADGFYLYALSEHEQSQFVGIRSTFYRISMIAGQGILIALAGNLEAFTRNPSRAWGITFGLTATLYIVTFIYHYFILPRPNTDGPREVPRSELFNDFLDTFISFFQKPHILSALAFMLLFRLPEALLTKICPLFLLDGVDDGGLALTTAEVGLVQGTIGVIGLTIGGILGGLYVAQFGFKKSLWLMVGAITIPDAVYIILAYWQPTSIALISTCIGLEQFGYGFGFTAYMVFLMYFAQGEAKTAHYAFCTGFMALSMMLPGMVAGYLQETIGYLNFFIVVMVLTVLTFISSALIRVDDNYGKK